MKYVLDINILLRITYRKSPFFLLSIPVIFPNWVPIRYFAEAIEYILSEVLDGFSE